MEIEAPLIAKSRKPGNFVIVRVDKHSERMPLTIADADIQRGTITLVIQEVGMSSTKLCRKEVGDTIEDLVGPLGNPTHIENFGTVICACGGLGAAPMLPIIRGLKAAGNRVLLQAKLHGQTNRKKTRLVGLSNRHLFSHSSAIQKFIIQVATQVVYGEGFVPG